MNEFVVQNQVSEHWLKSTTADGLISYTLTGVIILTPFQGTGSDWRRQRVSFGVKIPELPAGMALHLRYWAPFVTLNSISNDHQAVDAGWAVDTFGVDNPWQPQNEVSVFCDIAVRDVDGFVARLGYVLHLVGEPGPGPSISGVPS
ncbi:MAG: hypothetical protein QOF68_678 [Gaiellales bacterium]|jgi:hypothetical protein|nr:hypothetical protein [Gaiellales bacterium]